MYQVPVPLVIDMDSAFTTDYDNGILINCPNDALLKRNFSMHVFINVMEGDARDDHDWCEKVLPTVVEKLWRNWHMILVSLCIFSRIRGLTRLR